jgi:hypothetical protein
VVAAPAPAGPVAHYVPLRTENNFPPIVFKIENGKRVTLLTDLFEKMNKCVEQPGRETKRIKIRRNNGETKNARRDKMVNEVAAINRWRRKKPFCVTGSSLHDRII